MIYVKKIPTKKEYGGRYQELCHRAGVELLKYSFFKECGFSFCEEDILKEKHGKPYIENAPYSFNISHCDGLVVCALSKNRVGVDVEVIRRILPRVMKRCYCDNEIAYVNSSSDKDMAFTRLWTLKESYVKYTGDGVSSNLKAVNFDLESEKAFADNVFFTQIVLNGKYIISICKDEKSQSIRLDAINMEIQDVIELDI
ncbi:MAG: 4'-phosphopantetheinyl transferase superfamily protein [Ruminiclostridium sp.]|nr:4'-phosphopantetheinyl transferase superfamily protein [Ruminiclostridium sp.]